ncbi:MAG: hypothetical protein WD097_03275 [Balneolales bacterium]
MSSISRITKLARIPEIRKKQRESDTQQEKREGKKEDPFVFPLKGNSNYKKPRTNIRRERTDRQPAKTAEEGIGERLDLKV